MHIETLPDLFTDMEFLAIYDETEVTDEEVFEAWSEAVARFRDLALSSFARHWPSVVVDRFVAETLGVCYLWTEEPVDRNRRVMPRTTPSRLAGASGGDKKKSSQWLREAARYGLLEAQGDGPKTYLLNRYTITMTVEELRYLKAEKTYKEAHSA